MLWTRCTLRDYGERLEGVSKTRCSEVEKPRPPACALIRWSRGNVVCVHAQNTQARGNSAIAGILALSRL